VREHDSRGRHTTTHRELFRIASGALVIDTPGMRELQLWAGEALTSTFADVAELAAQCRFRDCHHVSEPGCALREALESDRLESYHRLKREIAYVNRQTDKHAALEEKRRWKAIHKAMRTPKKHQ
jgi:ribosome biogenesis GTPase / thiamine phosphate phosphatase